MIDNNRQVEQMIEGLWESRDVIELNRTVKGICEFFDVERFALVSYLGTNFQTFATYPPEWAKHYIENQYHLHDPVLSGDKMRLPFYWKCNEIKDLTSVQQRLFSEAHDFGVEGGTSLSFPFYREHTVFALLNNKPLDSQMLYALSLAARFYWQTKKKIETKQFLELLTRREREVLFLKSQGLSSQKVAQNLSLSVPTVVFHLKNARKKLNVETSEEALFLVGKALGQINYKGIGAQISQSCPEKDVCVQEKTLSNDLRSLLLL